MEPATNPANRLLRRLRPAAHLLEHAVAEADELRHRLARLQQCGRLLRVHAWLDEERLQRHDVCHSTRASAKPFRRAIEQGPMR
jgi:hypothetical protein